MRSRVTAEGATVRELLESAAKRHPDAVAVASCAAGGMDALRYREFAEAVDLLARGLVHDGPGGLGLRKGDRVALLAPNGIEWQIADQACLRAGLVVVPLYETVPVADQAFAVADSGARALLAYDAARAERLARFRKETPALEHVATLTPSPSGPTLTSLTAAGRAARERGEPGPAAPTPDDLATIVYTSGTTGRPKGVVLAHGNVAFNVHAVSHIVPLGPGDRTLSFLPLSHSLQRAAEFTFLANGVAIHYARGLDTLPEDLRSVRPTVVVGVPRVWEKAYRAVHARAAAERPWKQRLFRAALAAGERDVAARERGRASRFRDRVVAAFGRRVVFKELHARFGGEVRYLVSGGAPLDAGVERFFLAAGIPLLQGYGLTEAGPILTINRPDAWRVGSVGQPIPGVEVRLEADGEIVGRGPGIARGYWDRAEDTAATFAAGWLRTGDLGHFDADGFLHVTDRKKELLVLSNGKKVAPAPLEKRLEAEPEVRQAVLLGEAKSWCSALVVPEPAAFGDRPLGVLAQDLKVREAIEAAVARLNATLPRHEQVKKVALLDRELTVDGGELTPTLKVKRRVVAERFAKEIEALYAP